ncbi:MAG: pyruvate carboxylase [Bacteroidetes bacterium]|nr:pyruvate carboxylase [Bacteroidota bacterium]
MEIKKVLVANRGEIAIRIFRACVELNLRTVGIYTFEDRYSLHRYKADESYQIGEENDPLKPYLDIDRIIQLAKKQSVDAIHPGYGFLSENAEFARKCRENNIIFIGPDPEIMEQLGDKISAKKVAKKCHVPIIESSAKKLSDVDVALSEAKRIGFPVMLKATAGGGGRGMRVIRDEEQLSNSFFEARREAANAFGNDTVFLEKFVEEPKHIEVQILGDRHGNIVHLHERDCSVQRRYQKVVEIAPSPSLPDEVRNQLFEYALSIAKHVGYNNAGTVEFLVDKANNIYFIEVNPRIQVEHTVTEVVTGIDIVKAQIFIAGGYKLQDEQIKIPNQESIHINGIALQCRITTEDPENDFKPDYGTITTYRSAAGFGIRLDTGSLYQGVTVSPFFDSMLVKVTAHGRTLDGACRKMDRALREFRIRGVKTNLPFLSNIIHHEHFKAGKATVAFIEQHPELFNIRRGMDRATKAVRFLGEIVVNGNPDVKFIDPNKKFPHISLPEYDESATPLKGTKQRLDKMGPEKFAEWLRKEKKIHYTDTTLRDAHQSLLATRMRTVDMLPAAKAFALHHPQTFSMEVWGGATFDVCLRFLQEDPWHRLQEIRKAVPNILLQMLLRGSNGVGYKAYPDNLIEKFIEVAFENGNDIFRIFDSLNWMKSMEPSIGFVRKRTKGLAEVSLCYTGDILDPKKTKYDLKYYIQLAKDIENAGAHILAIKDMAGLLKPYAAQELITALREEIKLPIHLHTHDTSSLQPATYLKAIEAGVDVVDVALSGLSGLTSQPNFNSVVEMMRFHKRENPYDIENLNALGRYWELVREYYYPFESGLKAGTAEVFQHEIPGGQYSNLKAQAQSLGLAEKFDEITTMYEAVNELFGDIVKVTPSSKVVGDMAQFLVSNGLTTKDVMEKGDTLSFPESVQSFFRGDLGQPVGGFPKKLQKIILKDQKPMKKRPNHHLEPINFDLEFPAFLDRFQKGYPRDLDFTDFLSWSLYPKVWEDAYEKFGLYDDVRTIPTKAFFFGMKEQEEIVYEISPGKTIIVKLLSVGPPNEDGIRILFFKVNGQTRNVEVPDRTLKVEKIKNAVADTTNENEIGAPLQGRLSKILVEKDQEIKKGEPLFVIEAMKMETTASAPVAGKIQKLVLPEGSMVATDDLVVVIG